MKTGEACSRTVIVVGRDTPLAEAAKLMREHHVGSLVVAKKTDDSLDTLKLMRARGVRRVPVVSEKGDLAGIVAVDDLLEIVAEELEYIVHAIGNEQARETKRRR